MSRKRVKSECQARVSPQECRKNVSSQSVPQECKVRVAHKSVAQYCQARLSYQSVRVSECQISVSCHGVPQICQCVLTFSLNICVSIRVGGLHLVFNKNEKRKILLKNILYCNRYQIQTHCSVTNSNPNRSCSNQQTL